MLRDGRMLSLSASRIRHTPQDGVCVEKAVTFAPKRLTVGWDSPRRSNLHVCAG